MLIILWLETKLYLIHLMMITYASLSISQSSGPIHSSDVLPGQVAFQGNSQGNLLSTVGEFFTDLFWGSGGADLMFLISRPFFDFAGTIRSVAGSTQCSLENTWFFYIDFGIQAFLPHIHVLALPFVLGPSQKSGDLFENSESENLLLRDTDGLNHFFYFPDISVGF